mgnify:CR=1 FL=1
MKKLLLLLPALALTFSMCSKSDDPIEEDLPEPITDTLPTVDTLPVDTNLYTVYITSSYKDYFSVCIDGKYNYSVRGFEPWEDLRDIPTIQLSAGVHTYQVYIWKHLLPVEEIVVPRDRYISIDIDVAELMNVRFISDEKSNVQVFGDYSCLLGSLTDGSLYYGTNYDFSYMAMRESDGAVVVGNVKLNDSLTVVPLNFDSQKICKRLWVTENFNTGNPNGSYWFCSSVGDTVVADNEWEKIYDEYNCLYGYLRMSDEKMYWTEDFSEINVVFDWNVEKGDTVEFYGNKWGFSVMKESVDSVYNYTFSDGKTRKCCVLDYVDGWGDLIMVEEIGSLDGFLQSSQGIYDGGTSLYKYYENGKLVYSRDDYWAIEELLGAYSCE